MQFQVTVSLYRDIMSNNVFFQHPDLIRVLAVHETVMSLMVHTLSKASLDSTVNVASPGASELHIHGREGSAASDRIGRHGNLPAVMEEGDFGTGGFGGKRPSKSQSQCPFLLLSWKKSNEKNA